MTDAEYKITVVAIVCLAAIALSPAACTMHQQKLIADAIDRGADPIATRCAIEGSGSGKEASAMCVIVASTKKKSE